MKKFVILILIGFLVLLGSLRIIKGIRSNNDKSQQEAGIPTVKVAQVIKGEVEDKISCVGNIAGREMVTLMSKISGKIDSFLVKEGDIVKKDDVMVLIDRDIEGMKYEKASIKSPIDGIVMKKFLDKGAQVEPSVSPLMRVPVIMVANINAVKVLVNVSEKYLGRLKETAEAKVKVDAYPDEAFLGKITRIAPMVDLATRTAEVEIEISNEEHRLKPGMFARVNLILEKKESALIVPIKAVLSENNRKVVFIVNGSIAHKKEVKTGIYQKDSVEIIEGLNEGENVIIEGNYGLKDGANVLMETRGNIQ
ncbi:MAG: efflux RND transporter periplasmic adaptor subunit [Candidatus Aureabacteria bacterium]|nr:efflux RND transporter periplasmic adaptor subunit [Candidatus Auribacterota bacterium]